jgi:hypothetical protein
MLRRGKEDETHILLRQREGQPEALIITYARLSSMPFISSVVGHQTTSQASFVFDVKYLTKRLELSPK